MATVLVIDDEQSIIWAFERFLSGLGHEVLSAPTAERGLEIARERPPDLAIVDVKLPGMDGLAALERLRELQPKLQVIVITAHGTLDTAVRAVKLGAVEYLPKPIDLEKARRLLESALSRVPASREVERLRAEAAADIDGIVGRTAAMQEVFRKVAAVCQSDANVLLVGESGTGKELLARAIHAHGLRSDGPFEPINCASIPETLLESELFGHEKGAFTGAVRMRPGKLEVADGGTLFLDEVGDIPPAVQVKLLRFLEDRTFSRVGSNERIRIDVRVVAATNPNIEERVAAGAFREDLYFRLNVVTIEVPPLRARREDLPLLVAGFVGHAGAEGISEAALQVLKAHSWPGNVRELKHAIERGAILARRRTIQVEHLPESVTRPRPPGAADPESRMADLLEALAADPKVPVYGLWRFVEEKWEKALLRRAMDLTGGNQVKASELLGISRLTLRKKMRRYGLIEGHR